MARGDVVYKLTLDDAGFRAQLAKTDAALEGTAAKADAGAGGVVNLARSMASAKGAVGMLAVELVGAQGAAGKALTSFANLGAIFTPGGLLTAGIAATTFAVTSMVQEWRKAEEQISATQQMIERSAITTLRNQAATVDELRAAVANYGKKQSEVMRDEIALRQRATAEVFIEHKAKLDTMASGLLSLERRRDEILGGRSRGSLGEGENARLIAIDMAIAAREKEMDATSRVLKSAILTTEELRLQAELAEKIANEENRRSRGARRSRAAAEPLRETQIRDGSPGLFESISQEDIDAADASRKEAAGRARKLDVMIAEDKERIHKEHLDRVNKDLDAQAAHTESVEQRKLAALEGFVSAAGRLWGDYTAIAQSAILGVFDMYLDSVEKMAAGQEVSFQELAVGFVKQIGKQLFAMGLAQTFEGAAAMIQGGIALAQGNPAGAGQIAGGAALAALGTSAMAVGGAMATTGAIASGAMAKSSGGGGSGGGVGGGGRSPRRGKDRGGGGDGTSTTIVFNGGVILGDPTERARTMARDQRRSTRELFSPRG